MMTNFARPTTILVADDDADDRLLAQQALEKTRLANDVRFVEDGEELIEYLQRRGKYTDPRKSPRPGLILLDLNMPRMDGREALREIKNDPRLRDIPVVVLTTSKADEDVARTYILGGNSYIAKPVKFAALVQVMKAIGKYWFETVELPRRQASE